MIKAAIKLFNKSDLIVMPVREKIIGRKGQSSWFARSSLTKEIEQNVSTNISNLIYDNNMEYISINKLLQIAQKQKIW